MDANRLIALAVFLFSGYMLLEAWDREQHPLPVAPPTAVSSLPDVAAPTPGAAGTPALPGSAAPAPGTAAGVTLTAATATATATATAAPVTGAVPARGTRVVVTTDLFRAEFDSSGGDLHTLTLLKHLAADDSKAPLVLLQDQGKPFYVVQSGLLGSGLPNHLASYTPSATTLTLKPGEDSVSLDFSSTGDNGVQSVKSYVFHRASYVIDVRWSVRNGGAQPLAAQAYFQFLRDSVAPPGDPRFVSTYTGPAFYTASSHFQKVAFSDIDKGKAKVPETSDNGWVAMLQHYFVAALLPAPGVPRTFFTHKVGDKLYTAGVIQSLGTLAPGTSAQLSVPLYAGPQEGEKLEALAPGLDLTIDFGWLAIIAVPIWHVLNFIHRWVGNWGWAIVLLTVGIKLLFYPVAAAGYRSMAKMRVVAPKLQQIKEQYEKDPQKRNEAMMKLYKSENINPLGGCLPILIQFPVFIALYWTLLATVELRHAPFVGWIQDLSAQDPWFVLPLLMGATSFIQTRMQPPPPDPVQAKVMLVMPLMFSVMFFFFPAGLVLYYVINNGLSILQQWVITRRIEQAALAR